LRPVQQVLDGVTLLFGAGAGRFQESRGEDAFE
jgi:hypothetical protein